MKQYLSLFRHLWRMNGAAAESRKIHVLAQVIASVLSWGLIVMLLSQTNIVHSSATAWFASDLLTVILVDFIAINIVGSVLCVGLFDLPRQIESDEFALTLLYPASVLINTSWRWIDTSCLVSLSISAALLLAINWGQSMLYWCQLLMILALAVVVAYTICIILCSLTFWFPGLRNLHLFYFRTSYLRLVPSGPLFKNIVVSTVLALIPLRVVAQVWNLNSAGTVSLKEWFLLFPATILFILAAVVIWKRGVAYYLNNRLLTQ
jgi:ABC-type uncharacterized transport system permease subunit